MNSDKWRGGYAREVFNMARWQKYKLKLEYGHQKE